MKTGSRKGAGLLNRFRPFAANQRKVGNEAKLFLACMDANAHAVDGLV